MNKVLVEIEFEFLGDFLDQQDRVAEALVNICDPDPRTSDSWTITFVRSPYAKHGEIKFTKAEKNFEAIKNVADEIERTIEYNRATSINAHLPEEVRDSAREFAKNLMVILSELRVALEK